MYTPEELDEKFPDTPLFEMIICPDGSMTPNMIPCGTVTPPECEEFDYECIAAAQEADAENEDGDDEAQDEGTDDV